VRWKVLLGGLSAGALLAVLAVVVVVIVVIVAAIGGIWWFVTDDSPLLYYDARPAAADEPARSASGYQEINDTAFNLSYQPIPMIDRDVRVRSWVTVYAKGQTVAALMNDSAADRPPDDGPEPDSVDPEGDSLVTVFSMSALQLGPVSFNPVVYASDPALLGSSGVVIDAAETWLPRNVSNVTDVSVTSSREVEMLGQETRMTTFDGQLRLENGSRVDVRLYLARTVKDGELVLAFGIAPPGNETADDFATLVEGIEMGEWGATPGWVPPNSSELGGTNETSSRPAGRTDRLATG